MNRDDDPLSSFPSYSEARAWANANKGEPESARPDADSVPCSAWLDELEADLLHAESMTELADERGDHAEAQDWRDWANDRRERYETERRRSSSD